MYTHFVGVQLLSCVQLCDSMDFRKPGFPVPQYLPENYQNYAEILYQLQVNQFRFYFLSISTLITSEIYLI